MRRFHPQRLPLRGASDPRCLDLCERHARLALSLNPKNPHAAALLATALLGRLNLGTGHPEDRQEAVELLKTAIALDNNRFGETIKRALRAVEAKDPEAKDEARRWFESEPDGPRLIRALFENLPR